MKELKPWELLEKYKPIVITEKDTYIDKDREYRVSAKWKKEASKYKYKKWKENIVLWATPEDVIPIEFEGIRNENAEWINATEKKCIKKGIDYCIVDHLGKSPYLYLFNVQGLPEDDRERQLSKKALAKTLIPEGSNVDWHNFGTGLIPIINHFHWKKNKYPGDKHEIIRGKNPLEHKNKIPKELLNFEEATEIKEPDSKTKDETRSAKEYREVIKLIGKGKNKEEVFKEMKAFIRWTSSPEQYRELTYNKALKYFESQRDKEDRTEYFLNNLKDKKITEQSKIIRAFFEKNRIEDDIELESLFDKIKKATGIKKDLIKKVYFQKNKQTTKEETTEIDAESLEVLQNKKLIENLTDEAQKKIVGERETIKAILVCANGRNVSKHNVASYNLLINSDSSSGKDYVASNTLSLLPEAEYIKKTRISPTVFTYWHNPKFEPDWTWNKKLFYGEDISTGVLNSDVFKVMSSSGSSATVVINQQAIDIDIKGKPVMITTTAQATPNKELVRRFAIINLNETEDQTKAIMKKTAEAEAKGLIIEQDPKYTKALSYLKRVKVIIPYAEKLYDFFPKKHIIMRTHFPRFLDLIKAVSSLYQYQRDVKENNFYVATSQDYDIAREVLLKMTSNEFMIPLTQEQRKFLKVFQNLTEGKKSIIKNKCPNCNIICETSECPKCWDYEGNNKIRFTTEHYTLKEFSLDDLEPLMTFFTGSNRWLRKQLDVLVSYGFLEKESQKRMYSDKPLIVYKYVNLVSIDIPKWKDIIENSSNTTNGSNSSFTSNSSNT